MDKLQDSIAKINFLGYKCSGFNFQASQSYINGEAPVGLNFTVNYSGVKSEDTPNRFILNFEISLHDDNKETEIKANFIGLFDSTTEVNDEFINSPFLKINAPAILYPFIRAYISTITINAGLEPIILPTINFAAKAAEKK
jgi:preprotein translocase subunit SecB